MRAESAREAGLVVEVNHVSPCKQCSYEAKENVVTEEGVRPVLKAIAVRSSRMRVKACLEALAAQNIDDLDKSSF